MLDRGLIGVTNKLGEFRDFPSPGKFGLSNISICFLMDTKEFVVKVGIFVGTYPTPPRGCVIRLGLLMAYPDAKCGFRGVSIVVTLSTNVKA